MTEYIERDKLGICRCNPEVFEDKGYANGWNAAIDIIQSVPAADVRPVVLCRDCKYWFNAPVADGFNSCELDALIRHENFFCAAGEKREATDV